MKFFRNRREREAERNDALVDDEAYKEAIKITSTPETLFKHLEERFPDAIPNSECTTWSYGRLTGREDVINTIRHLLILANK